jgi:predicted nucleotidyltransferase
VSTWRETDFVGLLRELTSRGVDFVVIGGIAAVLHGSPRVTQDLDICFATDAGNLTALRQALVALDARLAGVNEEVPFVPDADALRRMMVLTLETIKGRLDLLAAPVGFPGFEALRHDAERLEIDGFFVLVASIDHLIAMKRASSRPKDRADLVELEAIRERRGMLGT